MDLIFLSGSNTLSESVFRSWTSDDRVRGKDSKRPQLVPGTMIDRVQQGIPNNLGVV